MTDSLEHPPQSEVSNESPLHVPVLLDAVLDQLRPIQGEKYLDLTAGYGGHATRILDRTANYSDAVLVDRDDYAIGQLAAFADKGVRLLHSDFASAVNALVEEGRQFDVVLIDLGVSSPQLDQGERGFSFTKNGPLDMRMDRRQPVTAATLVNTATYDELVHIITTYGEEPIGSARRIARAIIDHRPLADTKQLADLIGHAYVGRWRKIHPATRTFQALRIAVNQELRQIETVLLLLPKLLNHGGRVGIISFHSLEDRLVKRYFAEQRDAGYEAELRILTKKPIAGSADDVHNPRARSAKLRVAVKP